MGFVDAAAAAAAAVAVAELIDCQGCKRFAEGYCGAVQLDSAVGAVDGDSVILVGAAVAVVVIVEHVPATELEALSAVADFECEAVTVLVAGIAAVAAAAIADVLLVVEPAQVW